WRAGDAPTPPTIAESPPVFESNFSSWQPPHFVPPPEYQRDRFSLRDGKLVLQFPGIWSSADVVSRIDAADIELAGRATSGSWGLNFLNNERPFNAVFIAVNSEGRVSAGRIAVSSEDVKQIPVRSKRVKMQGGGEFDMMRCMIQSGQIKLWINGEEACEPI